MIKRYKHIVVWIGFFLISGFIYSQEDLTSTDEYMNEQQGINFQTFFFESLQQKAIENYDKAIFALEACYNIDNESIAVLFELSKNYYFLFKYTEAEYYILKGLEFEPTNIHLLRFLKEIKEKKNDYKGATNIQNKIILLKPEEESDLVILYIKSGEIDQAIALLTKLDSINKLPASLVALKKSLTQTESEKKENFKEVEELPKSKLDLLKESYSLKNDYNSLKLVLETELKTKQYLDLLNDSEEAINLYPAQPYAYLMNGVALNNLRKYRIAIEKLELGLEYLIDDSEIEAQFMEQLSLSYKGLRQNKIATSYYKKMLNLRKKE
ncbi:MAG: hypothetical protein L3J08_01790 [Flavobacteriaceae bacterium]|nr:hypothetical protein [Flavobacteriaceae bacterium]